MDKNVRWQVNITNVVKRLKYLPHAFYKMKTCGAQPEVIIIYYALLLVILNHGIIAWDHPINTIINQLEVSNIQTLKIIIIYIHIYE